MIMDLTYFSNMTPQIFPILGEPKCQLFFDLQAMIAENSGRLRLAEKLEREWLFRSPKEYRPDAHARMWTEQEVLYLKDNYGTIRIKNLDLNRSYSAICEKVWRMIESGELVSRRQRKT